ncbi:MAG: 4-hydroxy-3-methylbut-2-enyl diphosphate reductase [Kiritimatiellae bacterium]|nr:4-hydroxy-3-methylbut-2-enyl diphosphate reductase [Kiritimatiellia bacterium]MDD5521833.1 4-hydroxy-3-methylbut-2-enyl diphosphate reductase [Kiritimatiellia bacterium]
MKKQPENTVDGKVVLVSPHGFCAGVERAVKIAEYMLKTCSGTVYCLKEIVHNRQIVDELSRRGMVFVKKITEVPRGATVLFSAHGVTPEVKNTARRLELNVVDATCPFVSKVHEEVSRYAAGGYTILLIGHKNHDEITGVAGEAPDSVKVIENENEAEKVNVPDPVKVAVMTQTTLSVDETAHIIEILRRRFPALRTPHASDICYATQNRQMAVRSFAKQADIFVILGARNSSNSNRLVEVARSEGCNAFLVSDIDQFDEIPLENVKTIGLTAGASTPQYFVQEAVDNLAKRGFTHLEKLNVVEENVHFSMPAGMKA